LKNSFLTQILANLPPQIMADPPIIMAEMQILADTFLSAYICVNLRPIF